MTTLITLLMVLGLMTGCAGQTPPETIGTAVSPPDMTSTVGAPSPALDYRVELVERSGTICSESGDTLLDFSFEIPELTVCREDGTPLETACTGQEEAALRAAETFRSQFAEWTGDNNVADQAAAAEEMGAQPVPYELELRCSVYQTERVISISGEYYSYTGGVHPNTNMLAWNFDVQDGTFLTPEHLALDGQAFLTFVQREIVLQCQDIAAENGMTPEEFYWENYEEIAGDWSSYAVSFDETGMSVSFSPYEIACYAAGPQIFSVSYGELLPYLSEHGRLLLGLSDAA